MIINTLLFKSSILSTHCYWTAEDFWTERISKGKSRLASNDRSSVFKISVCLSACLSVGHEKKMHFFSSKFWFLALWGPFFGHFRVFYFLSFVILLDVLQVILMDLQTWFLAHRVFLIPLCGAFNDLKKCPLRALFGALLFSKTALMAKRHNCGHRNIIFWYKNSQDNIDQI